MYINATYEYLPKKVIIKVRLKSKNRQILDLKIKIRKNIKMKDKNNRLIKMIVSP